MKIIFNRAKNQSAILEKLEEIIVAYISNDNIDIEIELSQYIPPKITEQDIKEILVGIIHDEMPKNISVEKRERFLMGKIMKQCRGHIPGRIVRALTVQCLQDYEFKDV